MGKVVRIHETDNVIIALEAGEVGDTVADDIYGSFQLVTAVPIYHKIASTAIGKGEPVLKYGTAIGIATERIPRGAHVHTHNLDSVEMME
jgi:altronate dehydratase